MYAPPKSRAMNAAAVPRERKNLVVVVDGSREKMDPPRAEITAAIVGGRKKNLEFFIEGGL